MTTTHNGRYVLDGHNVKPEPDLMVWGKAMESKLRIVAQEAVGDRRVSTVFLGLDHQYGDGPPLLFETMVFPLEGFSDQYCERYSTYDEALAGHNAVVAKLKAGTLET